MSIMGVMSRSAVACNGRGIIKVRARVIVEKDKRTQRETIIVTELPYQVNKAKLVEKIAELVRDKHIEGVRYVRDESDREGMRMAVGLKKDQIAGVTINQLYKMTRMENTFGIIFLAIVNNRPEMLTLKEILEYFILHRKDIVIRRTRYDLKKAEARAHILEGLKIALDNIDEVVELIKKSKDVPAAREGLMDRFGLSVEVSTPEDVPTRVEVVRRRDRFERDPHGFIESCQAATPFIGCAFPT